MYNNFLKIKTYLTKFIATKNSEQLYNLSWQEKTIEEERLYRKQCLTAALRIFGNLGLNEGASGHISARDPQCTNSFWINPLGLSFNQIKVSDLILCDSQGKIIEGKHKKINPAAFSIHSAIHNLRPDVVAIAHAHSLYGTAWSALGRYLDPISQSACAFFEDHALLNDYTGVVIPLAEGERIAKTLGSNKGIILQNHGLLTVADSIEAAAWWFISMERCCQRQILAESLSHTVNLIPREIALKTRNEAVGLSWVGKLSFQPLWQDIIIASPDLFN